MIYVIYFASRCIVLRYVSFASYCFVLRSRSRRVGVGLPTPGENKMIPTNKNIPPRRKNSLRMKNWNYSLPCQYFFTICADNRKNIFEPEEVRNTVVKVFNDIASETRVVLDILTVSDNHIHGIVTLPEDQTINLGQYICKTKVKITQILSDSNYALKYGHKNNKIWQRSYYDHVIRNEKDFLEKMHYIEGHPFKEEEIREWKDGLLQGKMRK